MTNAWFSSPRDSCDSSGFSTAERQKGRTANDLGFERPKRPKKLRQKHNWGYQLGEQDQLALGIDKPLIFSRSFFGLFGLSKPKSFAVPLFISSGAEAGARRGPEVQRPRVVVHRAEGLRVQRTAVDPADLDPVEGPAAQNPRVAPFACRPEVYRLSIAANRSRLASRHVHLRQFHDCVDRLLPGMDGVNRAVPHPAAE